MAVEEVPYVYATATQNDAEQVVTDQIDALSDLANAAKSAADAAIAAISPQLNLSDLATIDFGVVDMSVDTTLEPNPVAEITVDIPEFNEDVSLSSVAVGTVDVPEFTADDPNIQIPAKPNITKNWTMPTAGELLPVEAPEAPNVDVNPVLARLEALLDASIPTFDEIPQWNPVSWDGTLTFHDLPTLEADFNYSENDYVSPITNELVTAFLTTYSNGGSALGSVVESAIWERAQDRINDEYVAEYERVQNRWAGLGWMIPAGGMEASLKEVEARHQRALEQLNYEITAEQAKLAFEDYQRARESGVTLEGVFRNYKSAYWGRVLEAAKYTAENQIAVYMALVEQNRLLFEKYRVEAQVFETRLRASLVELDAFMKRLEAVKLQVEIRAQDVQLISVYLDALETAIKVYTGEIEAAKLISSLNRDTVQIFAERINAYVAQVNAYATEIDAWKKEVDAESVKADVYGKQVGAYASRVQAAKSSADIEIARADAIIKANQNEIGRLQALVSAYSARVQGETARVGAEADVMRAKADAITGSNSAKAQMVGARAGLEKARVDAETNRLGLLIEQNKTAIQQAIQEMEISTSAQETIAQVSAQLAASIFSAINVGASISDTSSRAHRTSHSYGATLNNSLSEQHSYSEE
jgi:hypothetical protein